MIKQHQLKRGVHRTISIKDIKLTYYIIYMYQSTQCYNIPCIPFIILMHCMIGFH